MNRIIGEVMEIKLHPNSIKKQGGFSLCRSWKPLIHTLRKWKKILSKNKTSLHPAFLFLSLKSHIYSLSLLIQPCLMVPRIGFSPVGPNMAPSPIFIP
jgi:hypothetical protein